ncbi:MAG: NADH-quinone oxidoreductase subunit C [Deltaproteobacteria bacterium]|nr:NADH-quinone oxidoreductase subunit C [Deltaproteobacteria bacterium]
MSQSVLDLLREQFGSAIVETHSQWGDDTAVVLPERWREVARFVRDEPRARMDMFIDLTAVDYLGRPGPRFEVVLHLRSHELAYRLRLKTRVGAADGREARLDSLCDVWAGANWFERECYDMFGVEFTGHPDLRRILLYEQFQGAPLRKDYPAGHTQPLVKYRDDAPALEPPFGPDEGMPLGRKVPAGVPCRSSGGAPAPLRPEPEEP